MHTNVWESRDKKAGVSRRGPFIFSLKILHMTNRTYGNRAQQYSIGF